MAIKNDIFQEMPTEIPSNKHKKKVYKMLV